MLLGFFIDAVISPLLLLANVTPAMASLQPHIDCFALLRVILVMLQRGINDEIDDCLEAMQTHHRLFFRLYFSCMKAKIHLQVHVVDMWRRWGVLLSCFGPERHHKLMKRAMSFSYNNPGKIALAYDVKTWIDNLKRECTFLPTHLAGTIRSVQQSLIWPGLGNILVVQWAVSCNTECGQGLFSKGDLLQWEEEQVVHIGFCIGFARTTSVAIPYVAFLYKCIPSGPTSWQRQSACIQ